MIERPASESFDHQRVQAALHDAGASHLAMPTAKRRPPTLANATLVADLNGERVLLFHLFRFRVPPVPYRVGAELEAVHRRLQQLVVDLASNEITEQQALRTRLRLQHACARLFRKCVRPTAVLHRLMWHILPNPFKLASDEEVWQLLGFFLASRKTSSVRQLTIRERR